MPMRPSLPLDPDIAQAAAQRMTDDFADQPRPNFLFDADGRPRPLSVDEPCSRTLMETLTQTYASLGGAVEPVSDSESSVGAATESCSQEEHRIQVVDPWERGVAEAECIIRLEDGRELEAVTDADGYIELPADYHGEVEILIEDQGYDVTEPTPSYGATPRHELYNDAHEDEEAYVTGQMIVHI